MTACCRIFVEGGLVRGIGVVATATLVATNVGAEVVVIVVAAAAVNEVLAHVIGHN